ncbi:noroxomaritidine synthase-like [Papaver somniferum]|nr:noroxomaritidine synthase-like [Papaver somniferum]
MSSKTGKLFEDGEWPLVFDSDDINGLVYLHAALCESMRIYPPVSYSRKTVLSEAVLPDGSLVKPGMEIIIPFYSVGRMPWIWEEDCLEFRPERWIDDDGKLNRHENVSKFVAFSLGPSSCLGKDLSFTQMKALVAAVLFNFQIEVLEGQHVRPKPAISLHMEKGLEVKIQKRVI